jgi:Na+-transporting NADH:ubiquinone oxidoreductase subunit NqrC
MNKTTKILASLLVLSLVAVICLSVYVSVNNITYLKRQNQQLASTLNESRIISELHQGILKTEVESLRNQIIKSESNNYSKETYQKALDYSIVYIVVVQKIMDNNGVIYPEFKITMIDELETLTKEQP